MKKYNFTVLIITKTWLIDEYRNSNSLYHISNYAPINDIEVLGKKQSK